MKLKARPADFKVFEQLREGILQPRGGHRVYHVTKTKLTSMEAAGELAAELGIAPGDVHMAGLKDRQGTTSQYMSVYHGRDVRWNSQELKIETAGFTDEPLDSSHSEGNHFQIVVRDLGAIELERLREALEPVRTYGLPNYFDEQRFGNLRHGQGWIALDLIRGNTGDALRRLLASVSPHDNAQSRSLKEQLWRRWGDWRVCREIAGRYGRHHSVFEHLRRDPEDFAGAFGRVSKRERLIHLFAFQSHLWNRAVARFLDDRLGEDQRFGLRNLEGKLVFPRGAMPVEESWGGRFPLPGERLEGIEDPQARWLLTHVLERHSIRPEDFAIPGIPGFTFKTEQRPLAVIPQNMRARPAEPDREHPGKKSVSLEFSLPRGAYATLVVRRMVGPTVVDDSTRFAEGRSQGEPYGRGAYQGGARGARRGRGGPRRGGPGRGSAGRGGPRRSGPRRGGGPR